MTGDDFNHRRSEELALERAEQTAEEARKRAVVESGGTWIEGHPDGGYSFVYATRPPRTREEQFAAPHIAEARRILTDGLLAMMGTGVRLDGYPAGIVRAKTDSEWEAMDAARADAKPAGVRQSYGRCHGTLKSGEGCRAIASLPNGYCRVHAPKVGDLGTAAAKSESRKERRATKARGAKAAKGKKRATKPVNVGGKRAQEARQQADEARQRDAEDRARHEAVRAARRAAEPPPFPGQCEGQTKAGKRCRYPTDGPDGRCSVHR